jgi:long-subunit fatty acid transport protein
MTAMQRILRLLALLLGLAPAWLHANPLDTFGLGPRHVAMGGTGIATADDFSACYYNPAGLAGVKDTSLGLTFLSVHSALRIGEADSSHADGTGYGFGTARRLGRSFTLGFAGYLPGGRIAQLQFLEPVQPRFALFDDRNARLALYPAVAVRVTDRLTLGLNLQVLVNAVMVSDSLSVFDSDSPQPSAYGMTLDITPKAAPGFGALYRAGPWTAGLVYRAPIDLRLSVDLNTAIQLGSVFRLDFPIEIDSTLFYQPRQLGLGVARKLPSGLVAAADLVWADWSGYRDPRGYASLPPDANDPFLRQLFASWPAADFHAVLSARLGVEAPLSKGVVLRAGYGFEPSPGPEQRLQINLVDNTRHVLSAGAGFSLGGGLELDLHAQLHELVGRTHTKDPAVFVDEDPQTPGLQTSLPGFPGYTSGGHLFTWGAGLSFRR